MEKDAKIYIAGHKGLVGSAILRKLEEEGYSNLCYRTHKELNLIEPKAIDNFFKEEKPEYIFLSAAKVGGIYANSHYPAEFLYENVMIATNVIHTAYLHNVKKLLFLGSSCIYPRLAKQPMCEEDLLTGLLEPTNEGYSLGKIIGLKMCGFYKKQYGCDFISAMPTNIYGINDNFDLKSSHVIPALIRRMHEAKLREEESVVLWGSGTPRREFLYSDDLADALLFLMNNYNGDTHINVGCGQDIAIIELATLIKEVVGYKGVLKTDPSKPDGSPRKMVDVTKLNMLGWKYKTSLQEGLKKVYQWYIEKKENVKNG